MFVKFVLVYDKIESYLKDDLWKNLYFHIHSAYLQCGKIVVL